MVGVDRHLVGVLKDYQSLGEYQNFVSKKGESMPCLSAGCTSCYRADPALVFPLNKPLGDESIYYKRRREEKSRYLVARKEYWILVPHQC